MQVFEAVVVNVWPRVDYYRGDILEGLLSCWCMITSERATPSDALASVKSNIEKIVGLTTAYLKTKRNMINDYRKLIAADSRLGDVLIR